MIDQTHFLFSLKILTRSFINVVLAIYSVEERIHNLNFLIFFLYIYFIDGCHIEVHPPASEAIDYYNYKGWYSTVLLAVVDYRYRFLYTNVGCPGRCNDSSIYEQSLLRKKMDLPIFKDKSVLLDGVRVPVVLIGDSAFRLSDSMMKPYPFKINASNKEKNFNYSLSKCRRVVENAFGHLKARFRRLGKGLDNNIENVNVIIKCCCILHNFLNIQNEVINDLSQQNNMY